jgi:hypothetical protein
MPPPTVEHEAFSHRIMGGVVSTDGDYVALTESMAREIQPLLRVEFENPFAEHPAVVASLSIEQG